MTGRGRPAAAASGRVGQRTGEVRAFVALDLHPDLRGRLADLEAVLAPAFQGLRWVRPEGVHLTLRFFGSASPDQVSRLSARMECAAAASSAFEETVAELGLFPDRRCPRVLWLGVSTRETLSRLQAACEDAAVSAGFPSEPRPFRAHLTLGRWRDRVPRPVLPPVDLGPTRFEALTLFKSELRPGGSVHSVLGRWRLGEKG
ncbi:MAG TPA: RNA 2',3'-cyclic phosphodiesterase [Vicinamibacteria bacterium]